MQPDTKSKLLIVDDLPENLKALEAIMPEVLLPGMV